MLAQGPRVAIRGLLVLLVLATPARARAASLIPDSASGIIGYNNGSAVAIYGVGASWDICTQRSARRVDNAHEVRLFGQHVSNGAIKLPNWGLTYPGIALSVALP